MTTEATDIAETTIKLKAADGFAFEAFRCTPKQNVKGGLVVLQEIFGLTDQLKSVVRAYARDGYDFIFPCSLRPRRAGNGGAVQRAGSRPRSCPTACRSTR